MTTTLNLLHGFTQTGRSWDRVISAIRGRLLDGEYHAPNMPGHGPSSTEALDLERAADHLAALLPPGIWIGYSMGGRHLLHVALQHPERCSGIVLVSATAGIDDAVERAARRTADEATADHIERIGVRSFIEGWIAQPMFADVPFDHADLDERCTNTADGLASSLRLAGTGTQRPLWTECASLTMPALIITGELDAKFTTLGERLERCLPDAERVVIAAAGHAVHLSATDRFADAVTEWITRRALHRL